MRLQYILTYLRNWLPLVALVACMWLAAGCDDVLDAPVGSDVPEGMPAVVTLKFDLGEMTPISRADLQEGQDKDVTSLWVAVYNVKTGTRTGLYTSDNDENFKNFHEYKELAIETLSGESYIVAAANYKLRYATSGAGQTPVLLSEALAAADTWEKYCKVAAFFDKEGKSYFEAPVEALVMSGYYTEDNKHAANSKPEMKSLIITEGMNNPSGSIHLRRLISQIKFKIKHNSKNIKTFEITNWRVENLPTNSWLHERPDNYATSASYGEALNSFDTRMVKSGFNGSGTQISVASSEENKETVYSFDFYQLENRRTGNAKDYQSREKEYKNDDGTNSGKFVSLVDGKDSTDPNNNATYVTFHVVMEMNVDENGNKLGSDVKRRVVETDYTVHLGFVDKDATDFNCRRNTKYTYNVQIENIGKVIVEAKADDADGEKNPAVEGFVSDVTDSYYELDAHYGAVNVYLSSADLADFNYYITATRLNGTEIIIDSQVGNAVSEDDDDYMYLSWIEFRETKDEKILADYKPASNSDTYTLPEMRDKGAKGELKSAWYTMFVNEYVYEKTSQAQKGNESGSTNWKNYVNRPARKMWLIVKTQTSKDHESIYYQSKYGVSQQSIQCYYHVDNDDFKSAIGVEHTNETFGLTLRNNFNYKGGGTGTSEIAGRYNLLKFIESNYWYNRLNWSTYLSINEYEYIPAINNQGYSAAAANKPLPKIKRVTFSEDDKSNSEYEPNSTDRIQAINACMNRNRDLNGDGKIDYGELRWFVPTSSQAVRLILGRQALEDPLLDPKGVKQLSNKKNGYNTRFMFYTSDGKNLWAMEGTSLSKYREWSESMSTPWEVRCVRNLGSDMTVIKNEKANEPAFTVDTNNNIVDLSGFDDKCLRQQPYADGCIPIHHVNDQNYNRPYKKFEFKDSVITLDDSRIMEKPEKGESWSTYISRTNPCSFYNDKDKKGWRLPNQKEAAIIGLSQEGDKGFYDGKTTYYGTCTFSFFDKDAYAFGNNPNNKELNSYYHHDMKIRTSDGGGTVGDLVTDVTNYSIGIRCVRDIVE